MGVYASLRAVEGWDVPNFVLLLGLNNGPSTPLPALRGELDYMVSAYLANATLGPAVFEHLDGRPLVLIFDGSGTNHSDYAHPNFTIRWMSSQNEASGNANKGYWSECDGGARGSRHRGRTRRGGSHRQSWPPYGRRTFHSLRDA